MMRALTILPASASALRGAMIGAHDSNYPSAFGTGEL